LRGPARYGLRPSHYFPLELQQPAHRKASDRLPSFKLAERCCLKNQWGSNGRNVPVDSGKVYREKVDNANPTMEASFESVCDSVSRKADRKLACGPCYWINLVF
jgi:hypothetical protein